LAEARFSLPSFFRSLGRRLLEKESDQGNVQQVNEDSHEGGEDGASALQRLRLVINARKHNRDSVKVTFKLRNRRACPILVQEFTFPLYTVDVRIMTPDGQVLHYTGGGGGKRDPFTKLIFPRGTYRETIDLTRLQFGNEENPDYDFLENPGRYEIQAFYKGSVGLISRRVNLESNTDSFIVEEPEPPVENQGFRNLFRQGRGDWFF
jgi:hypothetical protein